MSVHKKTKKKEATKGLHIGVKDKKNGAALRDHGSYVP